MLYRSPYPDVTIPEVPLPALLLRHAERLTSKPALIDGLTDRALTYGEVAQRVRRLAAGLAHNGFRQGDVLAIYSFNSPEYILALLAVWSLGGATTTINPLYTVDELAYQLRDAGATQVLTQLDLLPKVREATRNLPIARTYVFGEAGGAEPFAALLTHDEPPPNVRIDPRNDVAVLLYSSGTTGLPKGVMLTHANIVANICQAQPLLGATEHDTLIAPLPFFHIAAWVVIFHMGFYQGGTVVTLPRFELEPCLRAMQAHRVTATLLVPPVVLALAKQPIVDDYDLSAFRVLFVGAAPLGEPLAAACEQRLGCRVRQAYGLTETSPLTHAHGIDATPVKLGSVGVCLPNTECRIIDPASGSELGANQSGELWVRGPQVMRGYLNRPDATAATRDADGWLHTGDIGYADADGYFFIVDRVKELIKYKGFQVAPAELEAVLLAHPAIADAAVIPVPDEAAGELPKAYIVLKGTASAAEILAHVASRVAPHKKIRQIEFVDQIPKTASGKILRRVLVERERARVSPPAP